MALNICIPVLNRYDLLDKLLVSLLSSTMKPSGVYIIDNGGNLSIRRELVSLNIAVHRPNGNIGVAKSWNWFLKNVKDVRVISNDDVVFYPDSLEKLVKHYDKNYLVYPNGVENGINSFSCFMLPDNIVKNVGYFDEEFFPAYYEDNSYHLRMKQKGFDIKLAKDSLVSHFKSGTLDAFSKQEMEEHHKRFRRNTELYKRMWGGLPGKETYSNKFNNDEKLKEECFIFLRKKYGF